MKVTERFYKQVSLKKEMSFKLLLIGLVIGSCAIFMGILALTEQLH